MVFHPIADPPPRRKTKSRASVLREIAGRSGDYNVGGVSGRPILTAYREQAIFIACALDKLGPQKPMVLRTLGTAVNTQAILHRNVYGWFERLDRGLYGLKASGKDEIAQTYPGLAALYEARRERKWHKIPFLLTHDSCCPERHERNGSGQQPAITRHGSRQKQQGVF